MTSGQLAQSLQLPWMGGQSVKVQGELTGTTTIESILSNSMDYVFLFAGVGLFLMLLSGGFTFLTSAGDSKKLESGKQRLTNAFIGFVIIFSAFWLVQAAGIIFGLDFVSGIF